MCSVVAFAVLVAVAENIQLLVLVPVEQRIRVECRLKGVSP